MQMYDSEINSESSQYRINNNNNSNNNNNNSNNIENININSSNTNNISNLSNNTHSNNFGNASSDNSILNRIGQDNDVISASAMSNLYSDPLIDEDHIDDQETINVGNLIIDLESSLEKEKIENEQANSKPTNTCTTTSITNAPASSSSTSSSSSSSSSNSFPSFGAKINFSTSTTNLTTPTSTPSGGKSNQKSSSNKHSTVSSINNAISNTTNSINSNKNTINTTSSGSGPGNNTTSSNNGHNLPTKTVFKTSADERGELKMRITRETKPGKSEHKIVNSPNQKSPTSFSNNSNSSNSSSSSTSSNNNSGSTNNSRNTTIINNSTTSHANNCEEISLHESAKQAQSTSISSTKECGTSTSIGTITEPDCLGPCEPGTSVTLEGIVWQETEGGILVVNVTWRGKTYVGALLDSTNHDWAPNRLCDSPASDIDSKANKGVRPKRIVTRSNGIGLDEKNLLQTTGKLRNGKGRRILTPNELAPCNKRQRETEKSIESIPAQSEAHTPLTNVSSITNSETACVSTNIDTTTATNNESISTSEILTDKAGPDSPMLIGCSEPNCSKKYRNMNGLLYHQTHAHGTESEPSNTRDNNCSSSLKDNVKNSTKSDQMDFRDEPAENRERLESQSPEEQRQNQDAKPFPEKRRTPSPQLNLKVSNKISNESSPNNNLIPNQESRPPMVGSLDQERRSSSNTNHSISSMDLNRRSPLPLPLPPPPFQHHHQHQHQQPLQHQQTLQQPKQQQQQHQQHQPPPPLVGPPRYLGDHGQGSNSHSSSSKQNSSSSKQINPAPLPVTTEEGMKPSGTSTGPPPAPHQANCYFNPSFLAGAFNPYGIPSYFTRPPLPLYDPIAPPTSTANAAFLTRFMNNMRAPPPADSPSRLLSPSMPKNSPFSPFKDVPVGLPIPTSHIGPNPLPNMPPMQNPPPLASGSPHMRMPSQGDPMLPPNSQPPFPPLGMGAPLGLPGALNPLGPQVPSLVDDPLAKQFPRRFN